MAIVVSHLDSDFDTMARRALRQAPLADLVELRLDRIGHPGEERLRAFVQECSKPVIVTIHGPEAFGDYAGTIDERCETLLAASRAGAMFVDIDWTLSLELGEVEGKCHRIVSRHDPDGTPEDLAAFDEDVRAVLYEGDAVKLVPTARSTEDGLRVLGYLREARGGLVAFCAGEAGSFTRVLAPIFGSPFTYAAPAQLPGDQESAAAPTAPGQLRVNDLLALVPPGGLSPETAILGVVGDAVGRPGAPGGSAGPFVHGMALKSAHLDAVYVALETRDFERFLALATDENFRGLSVTAPYKEHAFRAAKAVDEAARSVSACNTLVRDGAGWRGANTDLPAVRETLERAVAYHAREKGGPETLAEARALVLGAGGAARAVAGALRASGSAVAIAGRDAERARALAAELATAPGPLANVGGIAWDAIPDTPYDVLVHCTPVGTGKTGGSPIPDEWIRPRTLVLDAVYRPLKTPLLEAARARGCTAVPGAEWFVRQAKLQFELFTHQAADEELLRAAFTGFMQV